MEQGSLRCDVNLSLRAEGLRARSAPAPRPRTSTRCARSSGRSRYEISRHAAVLAGGRLDPAGDPALARGHRRHHQSGREKSDAEDYRYFPEPDLVPVAPSREWVEELRGHAARAAARAAGPAAGGVGLLRPRDARHRRRRRARPGRGDHRRRRHPAGRPQVVARRAGPPRQRAGRRARRRSASPRPTWPGCRRWSTRARSTTSSPARSSTACSPARARPTRSSRPAGSAVVSDDGALGAAVDSAIAANPDVADKIRDGKVAAAGALIGAVMKEMRGQADAGRVRELILEKLA